MKRVLRFLVGALAAAAVLLVLLQAFLWFGLDAAIRGLVLPRASADIGSEVSVGRTRADLLGRVQMRDIAVGNPAGFTEPTLLAVGRQDSDIAILPLFRGVVEVSHSRLKDVVVTVVRNKDGRVNTSELSGTSEPDAGKTVRVRPGPAMQPELKPAATPPPPPLPALLRDMAAEGRIVYVDHTSPGGPLTLAFPSVIRVRDLATFEQPGRKWGTVTVNAHLADDPDKFVTDLRCLVAPVADPERPTFDLKGSVKRLDVGTLAPLIGSSEVSAEAADAQVRVLCRSGVFIPPSAMVITLKKVSLGGSAGKKGGGGGLPPEITITVPIEGTVSEPRADVEAAVIRGVLDALAKDPGSLIRSLKVDEKTGREIEKGLKALGEFFK